MISGKGNLAIGRRKKAAIALIVVYFLLATVLLSVAGENAQGTNKEGSRWHSAVGRTAAQDINTTLAPAPRPAPTVLPSLSKNHGFCFSPYLKEDPTNGGTVSQARIASLLNKVSPYASWLRTFCSTGDWANMPQLVKSRGMFLAAGCDLYTDYAYNEEEIEGLIAQVRTGKVDIAVAGDETLYEGILTEDELIDYIRRVKVAGAPTTSSDSWDNLLSHPRVMAECDVIIVNIYPFWEGVDISQAVDYLASVYNEVKAAAGNKEVVVETGWPTAGDAQGRAVPSLKNARTFLSSFISWAQSNNVRYFYFEAFDEKWRASYEGTVGAHWGLWNSNAALKSGMAKILRSTL